MIITCMAQVSAPGGQSSASTNEQMLLIVVGAFIFLLVMTIFVLVAREFYLFLQAAASNAPVGLLQLLGMRLRKVDAKTIVYSRIRAMQNGIVLSPWQLERHYLAGGRVPTVVSALIAAKAADIPLAWEKACAVDLAGRDILEEVGEQARAKGVTLD